MGETVGVKGKGGGVRGMKAEKNNQICSSVVSNNQKGCFSNSTAGEVGRMHGGEQDKKESACERENKLSISAT